jgi:hypothetical protein
MLDARPSGARQPISAIRSRPSGTSEYAVVPSSAEPSASRSLSDYRAFPWDETTRTMGALFGYGCTHR